MKKNLREFSRKVGYLIPQIHSEIFTKWQKQFDFGDITFSQTVVLGILKEKGTLMMKDIANSLSVTTSAATGLVNRMVNLNLLKRKTDPEDRRIISIEMTKKGQDAIDRITQQKVDFLVTIFEKLNQRERDSYLDILERICQILKAEKKKK